jgi:hypothetical protein
MARWTQYCTATEEYWRDFVRKYGARTQMAIESKNERIKKKSIKRQTYIHVQARFTLSRSTSSSSSSTKGVDAQIGVSISMPQCSF